MSEGRIGYCGEVPSEAEVEETRSFLCGYGFCVDMLNLRRYERKRAEKYADAADADDLLEGSELIWRARMHAVQSLIESMPNGREKLVLYYHYIRGESIEHASDLLGISRRTGYRVHQKGLFTVTRIRLRQAK